MPKRIIKALVGRLQKPWKPRLSLPSYHEPTPETSRRLSREEEAEMALTRTAFTPGTAMLLIILFLITIASVPLIQVAANIHAGHRLPTAEIFGTLPAARQFRGLRSLHDVWDLLPRAEELKSAEKAMENDSVVSQWLLPPVQSLLVGQLRAGNEQVYLGRDGWLFYRPDVDYLTEPGFLEPKRLKQRRHAARVQPDPVVAIVQFRDQLAARGIDLVLVPIPSKAALEGDKLSARVSPATVLENRSLGQFRKKMAAAGVRVFDATADLAQRKTEKPAAPLFLRTDTHWRPETMQFVAQRLAAFLALPAITAGATKASPKEVTARGDVARMLKLPETQQVFTPETVTIEQITSGDGFWRPSRDADVLLLGDSFTNTFSLEALGWGEAAGFAEHLSVALGGRPLDCILRNSDGAFATREMLANQLARGRDRLAGKKLVIWEFAAREFAFGDWKMLDFKVGQPAPARFYSPPAGKDIAATGIIEAVSSVPRPGTVPYADHIMSVQLSEMRIAGSSERADLQAIVYLWSMHDNVWTRAARLRVGDKVTLRLRSWADVAGQYEQTNRSDLDDPELQLEEPVWGELVE
ncbi:MAG: hypothetical protein ABI946_09620 [Chthoniobacterales bacterium]